MDALFDLPIRRSSRWIFNCYTVFHGAGVALVDVGLPSIAGDVLERLPDVGVSAGQIHTVLCTHGHPDHVGGVPAILEATGAEVYLPQRCASYLEGERPRAFGFNEMLRFMPVWGEGRFDPTAAREMVAASGAIGFGGIGQRDFRLPFEPTGFVDATDRPPGLTDWEVIAAAGHTDDSTCFYHADSGTLLSGDAVVTHDGRAWFNPEWVDANDSLETEERLRALDVRYLLPGHGEPIEGASIWANARSGMSRPDGGGLLSRCARTLARWP